MHKHNRKSIRLKGYDYSQPGHYFITICTHQRAHWFGNVRGGGIRRLRIRTSALQELP